MTSPARAGSTLLAANPTAVARNAFANLVGPSGSSRYCQRSARIARFTNIVASDSASHSGRARTISRRPRARDRRCAETTRPARRRRAPARRWCEGAIASRLERPLLYRPYMLLLSGAACVPVRCTGFSVTRNFVAARPAHSPDHARRPPPGSPGQGPRHLRVRRSPADRRHRPHLGVRLRARLRHPRQGQGAHPDFGVLVRAHAADRRQSRAVDRPGVLPRRRAVRPSCCAAARCSSRGPSRCRSNASRAAICPAPAGRTTRRPARSAAFACRRACANRIGCPSRSSRRPRRRRAGHDINISEKDAAELVGKRVLDRVRDLTLRLYAEGAAHAESCGIIVADTKFEFGLLPSDGDRPVRIASS